MSSKFRPLHHIEDAKIIIDNLNHIFGIAKDLSHGTESERLQSLLFVMWRELETAKLHIDNAHQALEAEWMTVFQSKGVQHEQK